MNGNFRVGRLFGIPLFLNASWFLVLGLVSWSYAGSLAAAFPQLTMVMAAGLGLLSALLLFASVLAHELGHSLVALRQGIAVKSITLFLFGGLASLGREAKTAAEAFWVAIAGPAVSLLLFGLFSLLHLLLPVVSPLGGVVSLLATVNLMLAVFNLIPGLPLDGGNVLKAAVWKLTGNPYRGVILAGRVGQVFGWLAVLSGLIPLLWFGSLGQIWNLLIGGFLLQNAGRAAQSAQVQAQLEGLTAADAIAANSPVVSDQLTLREFADQTLLNPGIWQRYLVTDADGKLVGAIALQELQTIPTLRWDQVQVRQVMQPVPQTTVNGDRPLLEVVTLLEEQRLPALPVIRDNGVLLGLLERASILQRLQQQAQTHAA